MTMRVVNKHAKGKDQFVCIVSNFARLQGYYITLTFGKIGLRLDTSKLGYMHATARLKEVNNQTCLNFRFVSST